MDLKLSLLLNSALAALKTSTPPKPDDARLAIRQTTRALGLDGDEIKNPGFRILTEAEKAKGLYRRAVAYGIVKEDEKAIADLEQALKHAPGDAAISKEYAHSAPALRIAHSLVLVGCKRRRSECWLSRSRSEKRTERCLLRT